MKRDYPHLCAPLDLGGLVLRNRMCSAPLGATDYSADGTPGPRTQGFYELRARGGAAVVTVSELTVHPETDCSHMLRLGLETPGQLAAFAYVADGIKRHGAIASIELSHAGQYASAYVADASERSGLSFFGPSDGVRADGLPVTALGRDQIASIVRAYGEKAKLARRAGFQMAMVHAGHGWLLNQFLSPYFNKRDDDYGGSLENRVRIVREVLRSVRAAVGPGFPIELRMSGAELFEGGYDIDEGCRIAQALEDLVDLIHVSAGSHQFGFERTHPSMFSDHGCNVPLAARVKQCVKKPVAAIGGLSDPAQMEEIVASGQADVVVMGRALLADPELPNKVMANRGDEVLGCLRCFTCMAERGVTQTRRCAVNPRIGREGEGFETVPVLPARRKNVLVAGGGIAGMVAACTAAERGHAVTLCEAGSELGGILRLERALPFKRDMYELGRSYARRCERLGVDIRLNTPVDAALAERLMPDAVIVAVGSEPLPLPLPCEPGARVVNVEQLYAEGADAGDEPVVLGGGLTGCECALWLAQQGKRVHLVEMGNGLAKDANGRHRPILLERVAQAGIDVQLGTRGTAVRFDGLAVKEPDGVRGVVPGDAVVCAIGQRSRVEAVRALRDAAPFVRVVGDAARPANICTAVYEAHHAALDI
ncbi:MAG TPA: FAD-dependent oxidoreductase [Candidatus Aphodovivens avistercoris]|nr:FAD-dependent oxidoreductase [Candidatus Aphodovivens avistercoris]